LLPLRELIFALVNVKRRRYLIESRRDIVCSTTLEKSSTRDLNLVLDRSSGSRRSADIDLIPMSSTLELSECHVFLPVSGESIKIRKLQLFSIHYQNSRKEFEL
jgi:hypothetical protein